MCIAFSIPQYYAHLRHAISIPVVVETLEYRSDTEEVVVAFDCIVRNDTGLPINLWITHVDNVEGRLGTEDWFSISDRNPDENAELIQGIHDGGWLFDIESGLLRYLDPSLATRWEDAVVAKALSFRPDSKCDERVTQVYADSVDMTTPFKQPGRDSCSPIYRLQAFPQTDVLAPLNTDYLPFSTFRIGPIPSSRQGILTFFRLTVLISGQTYRRLVQPDNSGTFVVYSADRVCDEINDFSLARFRNDPRSSKFHRFFTDEVSNNIISPKKYQIVVRQPRIGDMKRKCVLVRPTSSRIGQRVIHHPELREQALWFNAWSTDFSIELAFCDRAENPSQGFRVTESSPERTHDTETV